jgi:hypothetical protein
MLKPEAVHIRAQNARAQECHATVPFRTTCSTTSDGQVTFKK